MSIREYPSVEYLRQCFREENGRLFWIVRPKEHFSEQRRWKNWNKRFPGNEAGYLRTSYRAKTKDDNRWIIKLNLNNFRRSCLIWVMHTGQSPHGFIDHKSRDTLDDRFENLRIATNGQNIANSGLRLDNKSGFKGVVKVKNRWIAAIGVNGNRRHIGSFLTPQEAHAAYMEAARKHFGEFACSGEPVT